jgi:hypothetical protein
LPVLLLVGCTTAVVGPGGGTLIVYSATYASTLEESEYRVHTDYTIATPNDAVIERVSNRTGSFDQRPASVSLRPGEYHVRAQYGGGRFIVVPITVEPGRTTIVDLTGSPLPPGATVTRLPDGTVAGWSVTAE